MHHAPEERAILGTIDALGAISLYEMTQGNQDRKSLSLRRSALFDESENSPKVMGLSMDWSNRIRMETPLIVASYNNGCLAVWEVCSFFASTQFY
jgi:hypothetical protein